MQTGIANIESQTILDANLKQLKAEGFQQVFVAHFGAINQDLVNRLSEQVEEMLYSAGAKKTIIKRIFSIVVEGLQNVLLHGEKYGHDQISMLIVGASQDQFKISMGNITGVSEKEKLDNYVNQLNGMENDEVKAYYMETLNNGLISEKGGAGLGFITMRMKSKNLLQANFIEWSDNQSFFVISAVLDKAE